MATEYFIARKEIQDQAWALIGQNHPDLAGSLNAGELVVVFRDKASKSGGRVTLGTARKATPLANALAGENYVFIIELPQDEWEKLDTKQREACLDHFLCACRATTNKKSEDVKFSIAKPDVSVYRENIERFGMWFPKEEGADDKTSSGSGDDEGEDITQLLGVSGEA